MRMTMVWFFQIIAQKTRFYAESGSFGLSIQERCHTAPF